MTGGGKGSSKTRLGFTENFLISGCSAAISKTSAAPIERVKLLLQNQVSYNMLGIRKVTESISTVCYGFSKSIHDSFPKLLKFP